MGHTSCLLHMVFIITFFLVSFHFTHVLISKSSHGYLIINGGGGGLSLTPNKFRFLLGLNRFGITQPRNGDPTYFSPSPSPSPSPYPSPFPSPAPAPSPALHFHHHARPPTHHRHPFPRADKIQKKDRGKAARILTAVLASVGVTSALCLIGLFFGCKKLKKQRRRPRKSRVVSKFMSSQSAAKKVTSDPGPDPFYLESLESALEQEKCCVSTFTLDDEMEGSDKKVMNPECGIGRCSSVGEITTVHEISESLVKQEDDEDVLDKIVPEDACSSDDESFHSFCDSHSSHLRLSNASACSVSETSETMSKDELKDAQLQPPSSAAPPPAPPPPSPPPPPPPPPPPRPAQIPPPPPTRVPQPQLPPTPPTTVSQPPIPPPPTSRVPQPPTPPPPPLGVPPPPFSKGQINSLKVPPPPPSLTQQMPLGKDGSPLPKLKPLHWDKVRAAPNRSTVWDKLRSSSFE